MKSISYNQVLGELQKAQVVLGPSVRLLQDSRAISSGDIFVAIKGAYLDGAAYVSAAITSGCAAVLISSRCDLALIEHQSTVPVLVVEQLEDHLADISKSFYLSGQDLGLPLMAITGTNGKTSICHLLAQLSGLSESKHLAMIGTMGYGFLDQLSPLDNTTPGVTQVYQLLREFSRDSQLNGVAMEVSSHALEQNRVKGLEYDLAIYTNLTRDHLDYHGTMEEYFAAKANLFTEYQPKNAVINLDDDYGKRLASMTSDSTRTLVYGASEEVKAFADYVHIQRVECHAHGLALTFEWQLDGRKEYSQLQLPLYGEFNASNIAAVFASALLLNWSVTEIHFSQLKPVPGRLELFVKPDLPVAIVDYAHTPDALEQSLKAVRAHLSGRLHVIFGCGGDRDCGKRPIMAEIAERLADEVVVTNDNPRTEDPELIVSHIQNGFHAPEQHKVILSRQEAIRFVLDTASAQDAVLIAGKGHETYQVIGKDIIDYNERVFTAELMNTLSQAGQKL